MALELDYLGSNLNTTNYKLGCFKQVTCNLSYYNFPHLWNKEKKKKMRRRKEDFCYKH